MKKSKGKVIIMDGIYESSPAAIDTNRINATISLLKEVFNKIKEKLMEIKSENKTRSNESQEFKMKGKKILNLMEEIADLLEEDPLFKKNEYYDFLTIYNISEYLFAEKRLFISFKETIEDLIIKFNNILFYKLDCELNQEAFSNYNAKYADFSSYLKNKEEYFFLEIYQNQGTDRELIKKVASRL